MKKLSILLTLLLIGKLSVVAQNALADIKPSGITVTLQFSKFKKRLLQKPNGSILQVKLFTNGKKKYYVDCKDRSDPVRLKLVGDDDLILDSCSCEGLTGIKKSSAILRVSISVSLINGLFSHVVSSNSEEGPANIISVVIPNSSFGKIMVSKAELIKNFYIIPLKSTDQTFLVQMAGLGPTSLSPDRGEKKGS